MPSSVPEVKASMAIERIERAGDPRADAYRDLRDGELLRSRGVFVAEGRLVTRRLIEDGRYRIQSVLVNDAALADLESVERQLAKYEKVAQAGGDKEAQRLVAALNKVRTVLDQGRPARSAELTREEYAVLRPLFLLTMKPTMYVANVAEEGSPRALEAVKAYAAKEGAPVVPISAALEAQIADMPDEDKKLFLDDMGMEEPGLNRVVRAAYGLLGLQTYFTAGPKEVRAWTVPAGATAPQAAGVIHTDFERGFIRAEVATYDDFVAHGGEQGAKEAGKLRLEGKDYVVRDGDVIHFRFNV